MEFIKYASIENSYREKVVDAIMGMEVSNQPWVVHSKIDGANFAFYYDGKDMKVASRNQFVDGTFYGCQEVIDYYAKAVKHIYEELCATTLIIHGELYGSGVQKRIYYGDHKDFAMFDIVVDGELQSHKVVDMMSHIIPTPHYFGVMSFEDALALSPSFQSKHTPEGYEKDNLEEGVVLKPVYPTFFPNGSRVIMKKVNDKFKEMSKQRIVKPKQNELHEDAVPVVEALSALINESRVLSATSKVGCDFSLFGQIMKEVVGDIMSEYSKDNNTKVFNEHKKGIMKVVNKMCADEVRKVLAIYC